ncbi:hypothetical protein F3Y22_tig00003725pilonHSYRG00299 [Hibiscus syriacus]|uniref:RING-type domain-containing protein n=1 Tax=Hibiscus syriacus TaxID=106335 RepID=A0A6A3CIN9_HIBSY|nr:hypothetical protein F3Y22_tig00003725pilonHSYRG00299 [Hibiscus syriacus]
MQRGAREGIYVAMWLCMCMDDGMAPGLHGDLQGRRDYMATYKVAGTTWRPTRSPRLHGDLSIPAWLGMARIWLVACSPLALYSCMLPIGSYMARCMLPIGSLFLHAPRGLVYGSLHAPHWLSIPACSPLPRCILPIGSYDSYMARIWLVCHPRMSPVCRQDCMASSKVAWIAWRPMAITVEFTPFQQLIYDLYPENWVYLCPCAAFRIACQSLHPLFLHLLLILLPSSTDDGSFHLDQNAQNLASAVSSSSSMCDGFLSMAFFQSLDAQLENERLKSVLLEQRKRQLATLINVMESKALHLMKRKEEDLARARKKTLELEACLKKVEMESKTWERLAKTNEAIALDLSNAVEQVKEGLIMVSNAAEDAESVCCGSCDDQQEVKSSKKIACKHCNSRSSCVLFLPCRHLCSCMSCEAFLDSCPVCKAVKEASMKVFWA